MFPPYFMKQLGFHPSEYIYSEPTLFEFDYGPYVTKRKQELRDELTQFIKEIKKNGALERIVAKYTK